MILKRLIADRKDASQWHIESAGTWARSGGPATVLSQIVAEEMGLDLSNHASKPVTPEMIEDFDLILTMEGQQKEALKLTFKNSGSRIFMLSEMVSRVEDVADPVGGELVDYRATAKLMESYLSGGLDRIQHLAERRSRTSKK